MDFDLSDDQLALRDAARGVLADLAHPRQVDGFDGGLWKAMVAQGWLGVELPEADGGLGMGTVETAVLLEELGRHVAPVPYLQSALALGALHRAGRSDWVERLLVGDVIGTVAAHPGALTIASRLADVAVVIDDGGLTMLDLTGRRPTREPAMDLTRPLGRLAADDGERIGGPADAEQLLPPIESMRDLAIQIAIMVGLQAQQDGVAPAMSEQELRARVQQRFWIPQYHNYKRIRKNISDQQ